MTSRGLGYFKDKKIIGGQSEGGVASICLKHARVTVEELDDVGEVHVVLQDDVPVDFHQRQGDEEDKVTGRDALGRPDGFPHGKHVVVHELWKTPGATLY